MVTPESSEVIQRSVAGALAGLGLGRGDRVVFLTSSGAAMLSAIIGAARTGIVPVVLNPALLERESAALVADADPALVIDDARLGELTCGPPVELADVPLVRPMHYTSGTTGSPKGVWSGVLEEAAGRALIDEEQELWGFEAADVNLVCSPLHHSAPIRFAMGTLFAGGNVLLAGAYEATRFSSLIDQARPTTAFMVPAHLQRLFSSGANPDLGSFRLLAHAGAPCPERLKWAAIEAFPQGSVWEFYGSTEGQFTACSAEEWAERPGTVGRARPNRHLCVDTDGTIWCEVPDHARFSYWNDPERTASAWRPSRSAQRASFTVGDLGRLDGDGYLWLDGRRDDLVITGGVNVYPLEVERMLMSIPGVRDAVVFGVRDDRWGERVCAAVVGEIDAAEVMTGSRARLSAYKCPKEVLVVDEIPITSTGKVRRSDMAHQLGLE